MQTTACRDRLLTFFFLGFGLLVRDNMIEMKAGRIAISSANTYVQASLTPLVNRVAAYDFFFLIFLIFLFLNEVEHVQRQYIIYMVTDFGPPIKRDPMTISNFLFVEPIVILIIYIYVYIYISTHIIHNII